MRKALITFYVTATSWVLMGQDHTDSIMLRKIHDEILTHESCYENLRYLCKQIGHRIAGSESAERAIEWGKDALIKAGADTVFLIPVEVPHWVRGTTEKLYYRTSDVTKELATTALGGSVGTHGVLSAKVIEVKSIDELKTLGKERVEGRIVFFNKAMDATLMNTGAAYGGAWSIRGNGPAEAARYGAVGCVIRSLSTADDNFPHTGATNYNDSLPKIPAAALSVVGARELSMALKTDPDLVLQLELSCQLFPRITQANVVGEIRGRTNEFITVGGHLDSWDIGEGAHDDGTGIVQSIEVIRALKSLNYTPQCNIRAVLFINEEFGNDGGETYAEVCKRQGLYHRAAIESDGGGFTPNGFNCDVPDSLYPAFSSWLPLLEPYNLLRFRRGGSGVDIRPLKNNDIALFGLMVDGNRYFDFHHSKNDIFENVNRRELNLGAAAMTSLIYLIDAKMQAGDIKN
jgi:carboxypeptidase Q